MKINQQYNGTIIGGLLTLISLLLTITFIIPIISILPGAFIELIMSEIVDNEPYSNVGKATIVVLAAILTISVAAILIKSLTTEFSNGQIFIIMIFEYFIIHSLGFYIYWATELNFRSDGQLIFAAIKSYPMSSFAFLGVGLLIDIVKKRPKNT